MKSLRWQFLAFFLLLAGGLGFLIAHSYRQMEREERVLWVGIVEAAYNQMQAAVSELLTSEDKRSFSEYRYYYVPASQPSSHQGPVVSPLSELLKDDPRGLIGYFQIDPDGSFHTPYLPDKGEKPPDLSERRERHALLKDLTRSFQVDAKADYNKYRKDLSAQQKVLELGTLDIVTVLPLPGTEGNAGDGLGGKDSEEIAMEELDDVANVYPNPLIEKKKGQGKDKFSQANLPKKSKDSKPSSVSSSSSGSSGGGRTKSETRRKVSASPMQYQTFQKQADVSISAAPPGEDKDGTFDQKTTSSAKPVPKRLDTASVDTSIFVDPFRARLINASELVFYRKVWVGQRLYLQGFAVDLMRFYDWLMDGSFGNSDLPGFALASLMVEGRRLADYGATDVDHNGGVRLFERALGYPLNLFLWRVRAATIPPLAARNLLNLLCAVIALIATFGLFFIYRSTAAEVRLSRKRHDFVSAVTHELKTPLTSIRMYSEMLEQGWVKDDDKRAEYYRHISKESGRLSRLVDNVLKLARLEKRTYKLNVHEADPTRDFEEIGGELREVAMQQGFAYAQTCSAGLPRIAYDAEAMKQVLLTLLDNSLKFSRNAPVKELAMTLTHEGDAVVWAWHDRGPGVPAPELNRIFADFYRVENEMTRATQGTGIGLAMARMTMAAMGGTITAENRAGGGLTVRMAWPLSAG